MDATQKNLLARFAAGSARSGVITAALFMLALNLAATSLAQTPSHQASLVTPNRTVRPASSGMNRPVQFSAVSTSRVVVYDNQAGNHGPSSSPAAGTAMEVMPQRETEGVWTLAELHQLAFQSHPELLEATSKVSAARGLAFQAGLQENPNVGIDFQQLFSGGAAEQYGISYEQRIVRHEKRMLDRSVQAHEAQRLTEVAAKRRYRIANRISAAFIAVLTAEAKVEVAERLLAFNTQALATTEKLLAADEVPRTDVLQARLETESARQVALTAKNTLSYAWKELEFAVGQTLAIHNLDDSLLDVRNPLPEFEGLLNSLRTSSPEVAEALSRIEKAKCFLARQRVETKPDIVAQGLLNVRDNGIGGGVDAGLAIAVPVPVWDKNRGNISAAWHDLRASEQALQKIELELASRLTPVYAELTDAFRQVRVYEESILPLADEVRQLTRSTYEQGEASFQSLLIAGRTHAEKQLSYLSALQRLRLAEIQIEGLLID